MTLRPRALLALVALPASLGGCGATSSQSHAVWTVTIKNFAFSPASLTVAPGDTVRWINKDGAAHTATADNAPPAFSSPTLGTNGTFRTSIAKPGTIHYHCAFHPFMTGTIIVRRA